MNRRINTVLWIGLMGTLIFGSSFISEVYRVFRGDPNIWWTHQDMGLRVEETKNNFELYIGGEPLWKLLSKGTLFSVDKNGMQYPVASSDIAVRLNNWDKIKASILMNATMSGFALGLSIALLGTGLIQALRHEKK